MERAPSRSLLTEAQLAHDAVLQEIANFNQVTFGPMPDHASLATARWRLSSASLQRGILSARIIQFLGGRADTAASQAICAFRSADDQMLHRSARHVRDWTVRSIAKDWAGYCNASREIRAHMANHLSLERELIFPLLEHPATWGDRAPAIPPE